VLAVGDAAFQQKCFDEFHRLKAAGKTIVFVTHDMGSVEQFCDRAMLMERGHVVSIGEPHAIARAYNELNFGRVPGAAADAGGSSTSNGLAEIKDCWFEDERGERITAASQEQPITLCCEVAFHGELTNPRFAFHLRNAVRHTIFASLTEFGTGTYAAGDSAIARARLENWLAPGRYELTPRVTRWGTGADVLDLREDLATLLIHGTRLSGGAVDIPHSFDIERR
jgi:Wzt C-terminal domain